MERVQVCGGEGGVTQSLQKSTEHIFDHIYTLGGCPYVRSLRAYVRTYVFVVKIEFDRLDP